MRHSPEKKLRDATLVVARHYNQERGLRIYQAFEHVNQRFFGGELPWPLITWSLTAHGRCIALTRSSRSGGLDKPPMIVMHPSLLGGTESETPWGFPSQFLGWRLVYDTLIHECMHVAVNYLRGGWSGRGSTSHNNEVWISEVNRIAPLLGLEVNAAMSKVARVPTSGRTITGKQKTRVARVCDSDVPFAAISTFPYGVRDHLGRLDYYESRTLPWRRGHAADESEPLPAAT